MARCGTVTEPAEHPAGHPTPYRTVVADGLPELDQRLSDELDKVNAAATEGVAPARERPCRSREVGRARGRVSGWTWGVAAGIGDDVGA